MFLIDKETIDSVTMDRDVFTTEQVGRTRHRTPEGYLYCEAVPIARIGDLLYRASELPTITPNYQVGKGMAVSLIRDAEVLFHPDTLASFNGKPVTRDHPPVMCSPSTFKQYVVGTVLNPRRGEGGDHDKLVADLLIMDADAIEDIESGRKLQISCGADSEIEEVRPGVGRVVFTLGNHVAILKTGRAGPSCAIKDGASQPMAKKPTWKDRLKGLFLLKDEDAFNAEIESMDEDEAGSAAQELRIVVETAKETAEEETAPLEARLDKIETAVMALTDAVAKWSTKDAEEAAAAADAEKEEAEKKAAAEAAAEKTEDCNVDNAETMDAATFQNIAASAEILSPGIKAPTFDAASGPSMATTLRRNALTAAMANAAIAPKLIGVIKNASAIATMDGAMLTLTFDAASAIVAAHNNSAFRPNQGPTISAKADLSAVQTRNAEFWNKSPAKSA